MPDWTRDEFGDFLEPQFQMFILPIICSLIWQCGVLLKDTLGQEVIILQLSRNWKTHLSNQCEWYNGISRNYLKENKYFHDH